MILKYFLNYLDHMVDINSDSDLYCKLQTIAYDVWTLSNLENRVTIKPCILSIFNSEKCCNANDDGIIKNENIGKNERAIEMITSMLKVIKTQISDQDRYIKQMQNDLKYAVLMNSICTSTHIDKRHLHSREGMHKLLNKLDEKCTLISFDNARVLNARDNNIDINALIKDITKIKDAYQYRRGYRDAWFECKHTNIRNKY